MSDDPTQVEIIIAQALTKVANAIQSTIFLAIASLVVMVYDTILTIDQEAKFVWRQRWSFGKAIFLFVRHFSTLLMTGHVISMLLYNPSPLSCFVIETVFIWCQVLVAIAGSSVLVVRTWLLCGGNKWILNCLIAGLIAITIPSLIFVALESIDIIPNPAPALLPGCLVKIPPNSWRPFLFPLIYETAILCVTLFKTLTTRSKTPVLMRLFRDGTLYYAGVIAVLVVTMAGITDETMRPIVAGSGYHIASVSIGCSRLILSLHSWSEAQKESRRSFSKSSSRYSSTLLGGYSLPQRPSYELKMQGISHAESVRAETSADTIPPPVPPKDHKFQSMIPDIERPSLPERMWSTLPGAHIRQQQQQRYSRPPRSSSLYDIGQIPERLLLVRMPMMSVTEDLELDRQVDSTQVGLGSNEKIV